MGKFVVCAFSVACRFQALNGHGSKSSTPSEHFNPHQNRLNFPRVSSIFLGVALFSTTQAKTRYILFYWGPNSSLAKWVVSSPTNHNGIPKRFGPPRPNWSPTGAAPLAFASAGLEPARGPPGHRPGASNWPEPAGEGAAMGPGVVQTRKTRHFVGNTPEAVGIPWKSVHAAYCMQRMSLVLLVVPYADAVEE